MIARASVALAFAALISACGEDTANLGAIDSGTMQRDSGAVSPDSGVDPQPDADAGTPEPDASTADTGPADAGFAPQIAVAFGPDLAPGPRRRIEAHLRAAAPAPIVVVAPDELPRDPVVLALGFGDTAITRAVASPGALAALTAEGSLVKTGTIAAGPALVAAGRGPGPRGLVATNLGLSQASYRLLEHLGFAFLHPLAPLNPGQFILTPEPIDETISPRWPIRGLQLHTMHPLELTDLVNGWGPAGPQDEAGWRAMLPEWETFLEWLVANGQNRVHWLPLIADSWRDFASSAERMDRFRILTTLAHEYGVATGVDVPIALQQQHAWKMIEQMGDLDAEKAQIRARVDLLFDSGFDYLATENGTTEFTHPEPDRMLAWMDELARYTAETYGKPTYIKIHTSTGQAAENYPDPRTGQPINFNFLPHYADRRLGLMPHSVQHYSLDDPAPTYGNQNFEEMRLFLNYEAGSREVVWHPETAYWVSFDIDVPLFLPLYADRRLYDLRLLAGDEDAGRMGTGTTAGARMDGQLTFSSGWEWGYWVQEVVTARAAVDPLLGEMDHARALRRAFAPVTKPFGAAAGRAADLLVEMARAQHELLSLGRAGGRSPSTVVRRNGQAYLQGYEAFDDLADFAAGIPGLPRIGTQPDKLGLVEMRNPLHAAPRYTDPRGNDEIRPLLEEMALTFRRQANALAALEPEIPAPARPLFDDLRDAAEMTALRAEQVFGLYDYVADEPAGMGLMRLQNARDALDQAALVVARRELSYRVPADRIAGWRNNPTAYEFTYLWTVRSLYFWWRDEGKAVDVPRNPCYLNIINPADIALGEGITTSAVRVIRDVADNFPLIGSLAECLAETRMEPTFPQNNLRSRP